MCVTEVDVPDFEEVYRLERPPGFVALHRCRRAPAFGGTRIRAYASPDEALQDALRLAAAMTRKYAINGLPFGGGKAVLVEQSIGDRATALCALGDFVESLRGRFITGSDLGATESDMHLMATRTGYIECRDGAEATSESVFQAIRAALEVRLGSDALQNRTVAIQGIGAVGSRLARKCVEAGARVIVADTDADRVAALAASIPVTSCPTGDILHVRADVLAPCAVGGVIRSDETNALRCEILCGGANNILDRDETADLLEARGIVYVPDFLANSGAAVEGAWTQLAGAGDYSPQIAAIGTRVRQILEDARRARVSPLAAALRAVAATVPPVS